MAPSGTLAIGPAAGFTFATTTCSQHPGSPIELCAGGSARSGSGQHVANDNMPVIRQRNPMKPNADTARTSIGANSANATDRRKGLMGWLACFGIEPRSTCRVQSRISEVQNPDLRSSGGDQRTDVL